jgi:hypothetical protein
VLQVAFAAVDLLTRRRLEWDLRVGLAAVAFDWIQFAAVTVSFRNAFSNIRQ